MPGYKRNHTYEFTCPECLGSKFISTSGLTQQRCDCCSGLGYIEISNEVNPGIEITNGVDSGTEFYRECNHKWKTYQGLLESFEYCEICDEKRK